MLLWGELLKREGKEHEKVREDCIGPSRVELCVPAKSSLRNLLLA